MRHYGNGDAKGSPGVHARLRTTYWICSSKQWIAVQRGMRSHSLLCQRSRTRSDPLLHEASRYFNSLPAVFPLIHFPDSSDRLVLSYLVTLLELRFLAALCHFPGFFNLHGFHASTLEIFTSSRSLRVPSGDPYSTSPGSAAYHLLV